MKIKVNFAPMKKKILLNVFVLLSCITYAQITILNTDFQEGIPSNFTLVDNDSNTPNTQVSEFTAAWISYNDPDSTENLVAASTSFFTPFDTASRWLITPALQLGAFGNYLSWNAKSHDPSFPDDYLVLVSTTGTEISNFTDTIGFVEEENFEWTNRSVNLSAEGYNNQTIYVAFVNITFDGFKLYIDDINATKEDPVGLNELTELETLIYPNPFRSELNIQSKEAFSKIQLFDLQGKILVETSESKLNLEQLENGYYFVKVTARSKSSTKTVLKF